MSVLNRVLYDSATILIHLVLAMTVLGLLLALGFFSFHEDVWEPPQLDLSVD